jgi:serine-type D-Ala-D-Ala carboxypeptidase/endopeptidase (penicillin-binding protein 4)
MRLSTRLSTKPTATRAVRPSTKPTATRAVRPARLRTAAIAVLVIAAMIAPVHARPAPRAAVRRAAKARHDGAHARVAINHAGDMRPAREVVGRREEPLTVEEETARDIERLLRGPLRRGVTGLFVADARTGEALFAVNADDPLNPASNVKLISTATALELLGPEFRYPTRLLGPTPDGGVVRGDVYLLGSHDPTLTASALDELATGLAARGVTEIDGSIVVGSDPTRDGVYRAVVPIEIHGTEPGAPPTAAVPAGMDLVVVNVTAKTVKSARRPRLTYRVELADDGAGHPRVVVTIGGTIARGASTLYPLVTRQRTAFAAYTLRTTLRAHGIAIRDHFKVGELDDFVNETTAAGGLPIELARHESQRLAQIVARINKWSVNWLADRVIMTAAALVKRQPPSMALALSAMYDWLDRHPQLSRGRVVVDTGSGLSYQTRITPQELVSIVRSAGGFTSDPDELSDAWLDSLSIAGTDGTLSTRFRTGDIRGKIRGKTGTLSTSIALSGILDLDPQRPLAFALVTNATTTLSKGHVRKAHDQVIGLLCRYLARTRPRDEQRTVAGEPAAAPQPTVDAPVDAAAGATLDASTGEPVAPDLAPTASEPEAPDPEAPEPDAALDAEAAGRR